MEVHVISCGAIILLRSRGSFYKRQPIYFATHIFNTSIVRLKFSVAGMQRVGNVIVIEVYILQWFSGLFDRSLYQMHRVIVLSLTMSSRWRLAKTCDVFLRILFEIKLSFFCWRHLLLLNMDSAFDSIYLKQYLYLASQISGAGEGRTLTFPEHFAT